MKNAKRVKKMRKLLGGGSSVDKGTVVDLKRKVAKGFKNSADEIAYLKNRLSIEENSRKQAEDILTKLVMCKVNSERIDKLVTQIDGIEKRLHALEVAVRPLVGN